ncbi:MULTISPECIES: SpaH/EbpB family LPXTG-anchored major pilin [Bifidobacterium]|uniref:Fimbrial subunit FimA n=1 Tax=Bifidobacterium reuteri DSM 23975 TaxID=1437610 RepID=A0A087CRA2_9BIFI|nr:MULTISPECIES: SpaH/EbpB family LPXTG-anchored major pilin [Bifidobacterium]KFI85802.1 fimbrial subunit FimA [Bifidobacterium reuteri DSM 23975]TPF79148.1 cell surface protein [Bifidobacterium sp. UTCIF-1]TPF81019.1 cell surface protein [Bifidobacterium sp. UTCIF-24]TPF83184.1 cell surface protein [Bifidobacterium sp. UTCIF-3]TPF85055.1 cell surface protein [Bifidobacterium sp. UTCIF-36]
MNSLTRKLAAGVIAAATMLGIAGLGATTANAANASDGVIKISSSSAEFNGKTVTAYQMFTYDKEAVDNGTATNGGYALIDSWDAFFKAKATDFGLTDVTDDNVDQKAYDYVSGLNDTAVVTFAKTASDWAKTNDATLSGANLKYTATAAVDGAKYTATIENLPYGYYVVSPQGGSTDTTKKRGTDAILLNVKSNTAVEQELKSTYPTVEKTVDGDNHNSAQIGDTVNFKLASTVPDMAEYTKGYTFNFSDTLSKGLTLNLNAAGDAFEPVVKIGTTTLTKGTDYNTTYSVDQTTGKTTLTVEMIDFRNLHQNDAGKAITVEYSATLNENAVVGGTGNDNTAKVEYSNDPIEGGTGESQEDKTYTYDFNFGIDKVDAEDSNTKLADAQFELQDSTGTKIELVKVNDNTNTFRPKTAADTTAATDEDVKTDAAGALNFTGLKEGTYKVVETKAPQGYNKLTAPIEVVITAQYDAEGKLTEWGVHKSGDAYAKDNTTITVQNNKGLELPSTGGMGTALFTVFGVLIVALGAGWYVKSNRKSSKHAA